MDQNATPDEEDPQRQSEPGSAAENADAGAAEKDGQAGDSSWGIGIALGVSIGTAMGVALGNIGLGLALGLGVGITFAVAFGAAAKRKRSDDDPDATG